MGALRRGCHLFARWVSGETRSEFSLSERSALLALAPGGFGVSPRGRPQDCELSGGVLDVPLNKRWLALAMFIGSGR